MKRIVTALAILVVAPLALVAAWALESPVTGVAVPIASTAPSAQTTHNAADAPTASASDPAPARARPVGVAAPDPIVQRSIYAPPEQALVFDPLPEDPLAQRRALDRTLIFNETPRWGVYSPLGYSPARYASRHASR
jgi:hypothetical protein